MRPPRPVEPPASEPAELATMRPAMHVGQHVLLSKYVGHSAQPLAPGEYADRCVTAGVALAAVDSTGNTLVSPAMAEVAKSIMRLGVARHAG